LWPALILFLIAPIAAYAGHQVNIAVAKRIAPGIAHNHWPVITANITAIINSSDLKNPSNAPMLVFIAYEFFVIKSYAKIQGAMGGKG
jgi:hypothetical protein